MKKVIIVLSVVLSVVLLFFIINVVLLFDMFGRIEGPMLTNATAEAFLQENEEQLAIVIDYLLSTEFYWVTIRSSQLNELSNIDNNIYMFTGLETGRVKVEDELMLETLKHLFYDVTIVGKCEKVITFQLWSALRNHARGIAYSIDGSTPDGCAISNLVEIEPLSKDGWYFYVIAHPPRSVRNQE